jgi:hypothetical protein
MSDFLVNLQAVAGSPYAFAAYVVLAANCALASSR